MATIEELQREIRRLRDDIAAGRVAIKHADSHRFGAADPAGIIVEETDGTPSATRVTKIKVTNGTLTDDGDGSVTVTTGGGGAGVTDHALLSNVTANQHHAQTHTDTYHSDGANEKAANRGVVSGYADLDATTKVPAAKLGTGTPDTTTWLRGDRAWTAMPLPATRIKRFTISFGMTAGTGYQM